MSLSVLDQAAGNPFTPEVQGDHLRKLVLRSFGVEADQLGRVEVDQAGAALVIDVDGRARRLTWGRDGRARVIWFVDGQQVKNLGGEGGAARLAAALRA